MPYHGNRNMREQRSDSFFVINMFHRKARGGTLQMHRIEIVNRREAKVIDMGWERNEIRPLP
jgi:hypothetical protein